ncbi:hybrid sensor histidine kinase/response regulator [Waterburya agarophytonicola K14]|uniref:histidine kinase n=1 Tax=Waterburya agarophytonicola KI4 TaxID=2874699 RepID=A0A964BQE9_9CYAN|nr:hybrid sensor histidine kinase/response regulator [Waterburya agarophytonicola]MCC0177495.1 hybrid sensor histidine kinase/response regulator [Waterburya agarophytonicola KI4]
MDTEQQIRLNFLDEAVEYFDLMESNLLGFANSAIESQKVDLILRSAHSIKGGAGMMSFNTLSQVAHRTEDFLKILRVRYVGESIETEVETLLLQSVDHLRQIASLHRQGKEVVESDISQQTQPIFDKLQEYLGELETADENALLSQNEDFDPAVLIFEEGVDGVLDSFESQLSELDITELTEALTTTAQELVGFGMMASLDPFVQLCESIQAQVASISPAEIKSLAEQALKTWRRSHALVLRGSIERLPSNLEGYSDLDLGEGDRQIEPEIPDEFDPLDADAIELGGLQSAFELNIADTQEEAEEEFDPLDMDSIELGSLQSAFELNITDTQEEAEAELDPLDVDSLDLSSLQSAFELESFPDTPNKIRSTTEDSATVPKSTKAPSVERLEKMVRVPTSQLKQFNTLFEQLVLNRNSINLRLEQLQNVVSLMSQRMSQMERSNTQLKQWYDRASIEGILSEKDQLALTSVNSSTQQSDRFDSLEMDRYSDIHLICQEQIETIVQLQEVATDIELGVQEVNQSVRDLHYTTKSMQGNVTRTQMLPFADAVKRCPRIIRDLNLQFGKQVNLKILGDRTLLDRSVIEALSDPLMHLLRNSFDHGIEDSETRLKNGKSESGTITIQAKNLGTYSVITLSDDGGGINLDKIRDRVCQMGLTPEEVAQIPDTELLDFIFEPGFSTAQQVTELSGRGVGMDVVKTNLEEVRGDIRVDTQPGKGTTFILRIPFSLSILRVAIVEQGGIVFALPANNIRELISCPPEEILAEDNHQNIAWNFTSIPLVEIDKILLYRRSHNGISLTGNPTINQIMTLVVGDDRSFAALKINRFWDEQELTTRSIDSPIPLPPGIISSVVLGDGTVIPLIDPMVLVGQKNNNGVNSDRADLNSPKINISAIETILVVDDSINVRRYLSMTLEKAGYRVEQAKDGREAVDKLLAGLIVQAVICDVEMPRLDGYGVLEEIKERSEFADLPIAMLTSRSNEKHRKLAMNLGASAYFSKPYNEQQLLDKLGEMLN